MFGDTWREVHESATAPSDDHAATKQEAGSFFTRYFVPGISLIAAIFIIGTVVENSGGAVAGGRPKAMIFVIEGFKGTLFEQIVMNSNHAPNLRRVVEEGGQYAQCMSSSSPSCCRSQSGPTSKAGATWTAAPGLLSIVTGVDVDKHGVTNTSADSLMTYVSTSSAYPTLFTTAKKAGLHTAAVGTASFLTAVSEKTGTCSELGVVDFECGSVLTQRCYLPTSCNLDSRVSIPTGIRGESEQDMVNTVQRFLDAGTDVVAVHFNNLNVAATNGGAFSSTSQPYLAQLYLIDAVIGQVMQILRARAYANHENWLIIGTSDHGGVGSSYGATPDEDEVVAYFQTTATHLGPVNLAPPERPRQFDVAPTVLRWLGILSTNSVQYDGKVQGICTDGKNPKNCTDGDSSVQDTNI